MNRRAIVAAIAVIGIAAVLMISRSRRPTETGAPENGAAPIDAAVTAPPPAPANSEAPATNAKSPSKPGADSGESNEGAAKAVDLAAAAPTLESYREEVRKNPHVSPMSGQRFAENLAKRFDEAVKTPEAANAFLPELQDCVSGKTVEIDSLRATCLSAVRRLGKKVPEVRAQTTEIFDSADPKIAKLLP